MSRALTGIGITIGAIAILASVQAAEPLEDAQVQWKSTLLPMQDQGWEGVPIKANAAAAYISFDTIRRHGTVVTVLSRWEYGRSYVFQRAGFEYRSVYVQWEYDCANQAHRLLNETFYSVNNLSGTAYADDVTDREAWTYLSPLAIGGQAMQVACNRTDPHDRN